MNQTIKYKLFSIILFIIAFNSASAQFDSVMRSCEKYLAKDYLSDGQQYLSLISGDQTAEFNVIFYGGNTYRVITCGGNEENSIVFTVFDKFRNEIFNSTEYGNTCYWDFQFASTVECFIEAKLNKETNQSGFAVMLIGLKK